MKKFDYKKVYKDLYAPHTEPMLIEVPPICYVCVEGKGNPNTSIAYQEAIALLYGLSYTIKMCYKTMNGYFEYVVPPLEGLWWVDDEHFDGLNMTNKDVFCWKSMIRLPEFVTQDVFEEAKVLLQKKKPELDVSKLSFEMIDEGLCVQIMHKGSFDLEKESIMKIYRFIEDHQLVSDIHGQRCHHEIYLSDFRRCKVENLKTVIRHPVKIKRP